MDDSKAKARVPANQKLWKMLITQAKTKFTTFPSLAASKWVHDQYVKEGGQFVDSEKKVDPRFKDNDKDNDGKDDRTGHRAPQQFRR